jgi:hypothetical protein
MAFKLPNQPYEVRLWHGTRTLAPFEIIKHQVTLYIPALLLSCLLD